MANWSKVIAGLKRLVDEVGAFWPKSTAIAGYAEDGPYHCEDCSFLKGKKEGKIFVDENGKGRCPHPVMYADPRTKKDDDGLAIVNIRRGCCEFVDQISHKLDEREEDMDMSYGSVLGMKNGGVIKMIKIMKAKRSPKTKSALKTAFAEVYQNTPRAVKKTIAKKGKAAGEKQRIAIALSKARAVGANIPEKK